MPENELVAEFVVQLSAADGTLKRSGATVMQLYDRFILQNQTLHHLEMSQAPAGFDSTDAGSGGQPCGSGVASPTTAKTVRDLAPGARTAVQWAAGGSSSTRMLTLRCDKGWRTYDWCAPFSPTKVGESILKLRPAIDSEASGGLVGPQHALYLRLIVRMAGSRRSVCIRPALGSDGKLQLPYRVTNRSQTLLAFCQQGCEGSDDHWDLLGAGEACDFTWDRPSGDRALLVRARDTSGLWAATTAGGRGYAIERIGAVLAGLRLERSAAATAAAAEHAATRRPPSQEGPRACGAAEVMARAAPAEGEPILLTASCSVWAGSHIYAKGWLCVTHNAVTFCFFSAAQAAAALAANSAYGQSTGAHAAAGNGVPPLPITLLPLPLSDIASVAKGVSPGALALHTTSGSALVIASLRTADATMARLRNVLASRDASSRAAETLRSVRAHLANKVGRRWLAQHRGGSRGTEADVGGPTTGAGAAPPTAAGSAREHIMRATTAATRMQAAHRSRQTRRRLQAAASSAAMGVQRPRCAAAATIEEMGVLRLRHFASGELIEAARLGEVTRVTSLLASRADPNAVDWRGMSALHVVCASERTASLAILKELLRVGADVEQPSRDRWRARALHVAARSPSGAMATRMLLEFGASPLAVTADGRRPLEMASRGSSVAQQLRAAQTEWEAPTGPWIARTALVAAVGRGRMMRVAELLTHRTSPNSVDRRGLSALHVACACADAALVQMLLHAAAAPDCVARDATGRRPLHIATAVGTSRCARLLLEARADASLPDEEQRLPLDCCAESDSCMRALLMRELHTAALAGQLRHQPSGGGDDESLAEHSARLERSINSVELEQQRAAAASMALTARVISRGPRKELLILDQTAVAAAKDLASARNAARRRGERRAGHAFDTGDGSEEQRKGSAPSEDEVTRCVLRLEANLQSIGVTIVDEEPSEVLHLVLEDVHCRGFHSAREQSLELLLGHLQVDSCVARTRFEVMLAPIASPAGAAEEAHHACVHLIITQDLRWAPVVCIDYLGAAVDPLRLDLEQNVVTRVLRLLSTVEAEWLRGEHAHAQWLRMHVGEIAARTEAEGSAGTGSREPSAIAAHGADGASNSAADLVTNSAGTGANTAHATDGVGDGSADWTGWAGHENPEEGAVLQVREMHLEPVVITTTVSIAPLVDDADRELQDFHPTNTLRGPIKQLTAVDNVTLTLDAVHFEDVAEDAASVMQRLVSHYSLQVIQQLHRLLGSLELIGNPAAIFADVRGGVKTFFREPRRGALRSPSAFARGVARGTAGLAGGVGGGLVAGLATIGSAASRGVGLGLSGMSGDTQYARRRQLAAQTKAAGMRQGLRMGAEALRDGVHSGITGLIRQPVRGAMESGASGAARGVALGIAGAFAKPLSGFAGFASKVTEGIGSEAKRFTPAAQEAAQANRQGAMLLRVRQPRWLADGVLRPYPRRDHHAHATAASSTAGGETEGATDNDLEGEVGDSR